MICLIVAEAAIFIIFVLPTSFTRQKPQRPHTPEVLQAAGPGNRVFVVQQSSRTLRGDCFREKRGAVECPVAGLTVLLGGSFSPAPRWSGMS